MLQEVSFLLSCITNCRPNNDKIAIILWLYNTDLWPEFFSLLGPLSDKIKLYIGLCTENSLTNNNIYKDLQNFDHSIYTQDNFGCDVAPFLNQIQHVSEQVFIKIHGKMSNWGVKNHVCWRSVLVNDLIGSREIFEDNTTNIKNDNIGMISNKILLLDNREILNKRKIQKTCKIIGMDYGKVKNSYFPAGNMFLSKTDIFKKYFNSDTVGELTKKLKKEKGKVSDLNCGTYSHSLERVFGYIIKNENKQFSSPNHKSIKIINNKAENGYYNMIVTYNNKCYLEEDLNACGEIVEKNKDKMLIKWMHMPDIIYQEYDVLQDGEIRKISK